MERRTLSTWRRWVACGVAAAAVSSCGNRLSQDEILAVEAQRGSVVPGQTRSSGTSGSLPDTTALGSAAAGAVAAPAAPGGAPTPDAGVAATDPGTVAASCQASASPIRVGHVGTYSGAVGASYAGGDATLRLWAQWVNERGGIACHPVEVLVANDDGNPARTRSIVQDMVENQGVIAFVGPLLPLSLQGAVPYLEERGIPVVGGDGASRGWWESPVLFPHTTFMDDTITAGARIAVASGKPQLSMLYCGEAAACADVRRTLTDPANQASAGYSLVHQAQISLAQPDFTAECISARNAGAQAVWIAADSSTISRLARSCSAQGYRPLYVTQATAVTGALLDDPNIAELAFGSGVFPFVADDFPAAAEYQQALAQLGGGEARPSGAGAVTWAAGKLFERVGAGFPADPTPADVLAGLRSLQGETLGGLVPPLTFAEGQPAARSACYFEMLLRDGAWVTPRGTGVICP